MASAGRQWRKANFCIHLARSLRWLSPVCLPFGAGGLEPGRRRTISRACPNCTTVLIDDFSHTNRRASGSVGSRAECPGPAGARGRGWRAQDARRCQSNGALVGLAALGASGSRVQGRAPACCLATKLFRVGARNATLAGRQARRLHPERAWACSWGLCVDLCIRGFKHSDTRTLANGPACRRLLPARRRN